MYNLKKKNGKKWIVSTVFMHDEGISLIKCNDLRYKLCNLHTYYTIYLHYTTPYLPNYLLRIVYTQYTHSMTALCIHLGTHKFTYFICKEDYFIRYFFTLPCIYAV